MRKDMSFPSKGLTCRGWIYRPERAAGGNKHPAIVMAHGFSGVKEQILPEVAQRFADAGFAVLLFDYRYFGDSDGEPRGQLFPLEQAEDYRNAITWLQKQSDIDETRIGIWGTSFSGGIVAWVGTFDRRVKAVVAQVPGLTNAESRRAADPEKWEQVGQLLIEDRIARYDSGASKKFPVVAPEGEPAILPGQDCYDAFMELRELASNWRNEITVESLEKVREFDPVSLIHMMAPTPILVIAAEADSLIPIDAVRAAYEKAEPPKELIVHPIGHFDIYQDPWLSRAADDAIAWFGEHLT